MNISKKVLIGLFSSSMILMSCNSGNSSSEDMEAYEDSLEMSEKMSETGNEHPANNEGEHPSSDASSEHPSDEAHETSMEEEREEIKLTLLPPAITEELKTEPYLDCKVERAFSYNNDGEKAYEVRVKRGEGSETFHFNEKGIRIDK
ncbi:hypothetical protein CW751_09120 [Brumimicrobium salinarum]|uniref:Uncharacterized protein n=1 Tax=Brumimicrobium salinarum TaxID=2058658 RepID=A0A2I0R1U0_9FLAO|nr:hypothetical protein [Brumimicrobium salinarum]PKR80525.1 hypothetical protein CW751_09120 [Brumimicrobium salinarum]